MVSPFLRQIVRFGVDFATANPISPGILFDVSSDPVCVCQLRIG
jgi:hypothetical protein